MYKYIYIYIYIYIYMCVYIIYVYMNIYISDQLLIRVCLHYFNYLELCTSYVWGMVTVCVGEGEIEREGVWYLAHLCCCVVTCVPWECYIFPVGRLGRWASSGLVVGDNKCGFTARCNTHSAPVCSSARKPKLSMQFGGIPWGIFCRKM